MKTLKSLAVTAIIFLGYSISFCQTPLNLNEGLKAAKSSGKKIFVDVFSRGDKWSIKMDSEIYTLPEIQSALSGFVFVKLNADGQDKINYNGKEYTSSELAKALGSTGYPTFLFMNSDGSVIKFRYNGEEENNICGFLGADDFKELLEFFSNESYKSSDLSTVFSN